MRKRTTLPIGGLLLLGGILLYLGVHIAAVLHMPEIDFWQESTGRYRTALMDSGGYWMFWLSMGFMAMGLVLMGVELFGKLGQRGQDERNRIRRRDQEFEARREEDWRQGQS